MAPIIAEDRQRFLRQDMVSPAHSGACGTHDESADCHHDENVERVCGTALRLDEVMRRFSKEAVLGCVDTGRYRCKYYSWGSGPPLIFLHGLGDEALTFVMPIARLSEHFRCIAYDQPRGQGDGAHLGKIHHADLVADLFALMDHLKLPQANLLGCSFGTTLALAAMHQQPERFPRGVLVSGFAYRPLAVAEEMLACWARYWRGYMSSLPLRINMMKHVHYAPFAAREPDLWQFFLERDGAMPMEAMARRALLLNQVDLRPILPEIHQPLLLVCGEQDPLVGKKCEEVLMERLPNARRAELAGCGHMAQFTHAEALAEAVWRFLR